MDSIKKIYQTINALSEKINSITASIDILSNIRADANEQAVADAQNGLIDLDESRLQAEADAENALIELDEEIHQSLAEIENALCELTEEGGY